MSCKNDITAGFAIGFLCVVGAMSVSGCSKKPAWHNGENSRDVALGEFATAPETVRTADLPIERIDLGDADQSSPESMPDDAGTVTIVEAMPGGEGDDSTPKTAPGTAPTKRLKVGDQVVVDSLIGQVNGRPIFADEFFAPIAAQLRAASVRLKPQQFRQEAARIVTTHLDEVVLNELFLAEAESSLTSDERKGIFAFMSHLQQRMVSQSGGIEQEARQRLALEDMTLEQYLELEKNRALIQKLIMEKIRPRVIVSWRDIEREYDRRREEFNPPAQVTLARIRLNTQDDKTLIEQVQTRLANDEPFTVIATDCGMHDGGTWRTIKMGGAGDNEVVLSEQFIDRLGDIEIGKTTEPFEVGSSTWWLYIATIDQPPARSIYDPDVQRMLSDNLHSARFSEEFKRYQAKLFQRGIFDELNEMRDRLMAVALLRFGK